MKADIHIISSEAVLESPANEGGGGGGRKGFIIREQWAIIVVILIPMFSGWTHTYHFIKCIA